MFHAKDISQDSFLVTGGAGFIGSNIVEYLLKHNAKKIRILDNLSTGHFSNIETFVREPSVEFWEGSITDSDRCLRACEGMRYVSHQAALGSVPRSLKEPIASNEANVTGFLNILWACKEQGVQRLVYASSSSVYGDALASPKQEANIGSPLSPYALTKLINEQYAAVFAKNYEGFDAIGLRYFNIFGYRQSPEGAYAAVIPLFIQHLLDKKSPLIHGDGGQSRDFTFVENAVQANIKALFAGKDAANKVYNIACGASLSVKEIFEILRDTLDVWVEANFVDARKGDIRNSLADISRAKQFLDYQPTVFAYEGLKKTVDWFLRKLQA